MLNAEIMLSVVIPTRNDERGLVPTLASLVSGSADGVVRDVTLADGGSSDATLEIADLAGCNVIGGGAALGARLDAAARGSKGPWILFLEPGVILDEGWHREIRATVDALERTGEAERRAAVFRFGVDGFDGRDRITEKLSSLRAFLTGLPRPEQGLLIRKSFYEALGGFRSLSAMAEADLLRRIGGRRIVRLRARALSPASDPSKRRSLASAPRAAIGGALLVLRVPPRFLARLYG